MSQILQTARAYARYGGPEGPSAAPGLGCSPAGCGYDVALPAAFIENPEFLPNGPFGAIAAERGSAFYD